MERVALSALGMVRAGLGLGCLVLIVGQVLGQLEMGVVGVVRRMRVVGVVGVVRRRLVVRGVVVVRRRLSRLLVGGVRLVALVDR